MFSPSLTPPARRGIYVARRLKEASGSAHTHPWTTNYLHAPPRPTTDITWVHRLPPPCPPSPPPSAPQHPPKQGGLCVRNAIGRTWSSTATSSPKKSARAMGRGPFRPQWMATLPLGPGVPTPSTHPKGNAKTTTARGWPPTPANCWSFESTTKQNVETCAPPNRRTSVTATLLCCVPPPPNRCATCARPTR